MLQPLSYCRYPLCHRATQNPRKLVYVCYCFFVIVKFYSFILLGLSFYIYLYITVYVYIQFVLCIIVYSILESIVKCLWFVLLVFFWFFFFSCFLPSIMKEKVVQRCLKRLLNVRRYSCIQVILKRQFI